MNLQSFKTSTDQHTLSKESSQFYAYAYKIILGQNLTYALCIILA